MIICFNFSYSRLT